MKLHIITISKPKHLYAREGWREYTKRLQGFHQLRVTHIPDKNNDTMHILQAVGETDLVALEIDGKVMSSEELAGFIEQQSSFSSRELSFLIGGPEGIPAEVSDRAMLRLSLSGLTLPHDLAMVVLVEALYRASTINAKHPYHK